jgi:hypothetical protein
MKRDNGQCKNQTNRTSFPKTVAELVIQNIREENSSVNKAKEKQWKKAVKQQKLPAKSGLTVLTSLISA